MLIRAAQRQYVDWISDSRRWDRFQPRRGDVVIATAPKCGTTWVQRIVGLLIFGTTEPRSVDDESPWMDMAFYPLDAIYDTIEAQEHRRYLKTHLPLDCLPLHSEVHYIHVARDGRDACTSIHDMVIGTSQSARQLSSEMAKYYGAIPDDPQDFFRYWLSTAVTKGQSDGAPFISFFDIETSFWSGRKLDNLLMVHYSDLTADLDGEMRRIAGFLGIDVNEAIWPDLVRAATFEEMRKSGAQIKPHAAHSMEKGANGFFNKGTGGRWREHLSDDNLQLYNDKVAEKFSPNLASWIEHGRLGAGDPSELGD
jgi:aryl sulfotransferase